MTNIYFIRHAESDTNVHDDLTRPLTAKGLDDRRLVTDYLEDKSVTRIISSPFKRAYDTIEPFARKRGLEICCVDGFQERQTANVWVADFHAYTKQQWSDFTHKLTGGESLHEVQQRNITALETLLLSYPDETIVVGTHGTALSTIINFYDKSYNHDSFMAMAKLMPWVAHFVFEGSRCASITYVNLFQ